MCPSPSYAPQPGCVGLALPAPEPWWMRAHLLAGGGVQWLGQCTKLMAAMVCSCWARESIAQRALFSRLLSVLSLLEKGQPFLPPSGHASMKRLQCPLALLPLPSLTPANKRVSSGTVNLPLVATLMLPCCCAKKTACCILLPSLPQGTSSGLSLVSFPDPNPASPEGELG